MMKNIVVKNRGGRVLNYNERVLEAAKKMHRDGLVAGTSGNVSMLDRVNQAIAITPSGLDYEVMEAEDITVIDFNGKIIEGCQKPSSEWRMHAVMYEKLPDVGAIVHTHAPYATSFSVLNERIPVVLIEMVLLGGDVQVAPFAMSGSRNLGLSVADTLLKTDRYACLLQNHGAVTIGETLEEAMMRSIYLEDAAKIYHYACSVGIPKEIDEEKINEMMIQLGMKGRV